MVTRTRNDLVSKIAEVLTGEALPRRQSTNVIDRRGEAKGDQFYDELAEIERAAKQRLQMEKIRGLAWRLNNKPLDVEKARKFWSGNHQDVWGKPPK